MHNCVTFDLLSGLYELTYFHCFVPETKTILVYRYRKQNLNRHSLLLKNRRKEGEVNSNTSDAQCNSTLHPPL